MMRIELQKPVLAVAQSCAISAHAQIAPGAIQFAHLNPSHSKHDQPRLLEEPRLSTTSVSFERGGRAD